MMVEGEAGSANKDVVAGMTFDLQALAYALLVIELGSFRKAASGLQVRP
jgi:hypothetical protein